MPTQELLGGSVVGFATRAVRIPFKNGLAVAGRFTKADGSRDHAAVKPLGEVVLHFLDDLAGKIGAAVVHGHEDSLDFPKAHPMGVR